MQFKHPEILYFLFLLLIPILVHLFQLRRFKKEYFTNVKLLKQLSIQTRKSSKIKKWLLLTVRLFLLGFLILAFAQPFFKSKDTKKATNEMYLIVDNSFSMQAKGKKGELLKRTVQDLLENIPENQQFSLITNSESYWDTDIRAIRKELQNVKYSALPFSLESAISKIKSRKSALNKDVIVITDAIGLSPKSLKSIDKEYNTYFIIPKAEHKNNISIDSVYINQTLENFYEIGVKLTSYGSDSKNIPIALYNQKKLVAKTLINFEKNQKIINFTIPKGDFNGYVFIQDKGLEYDNTFYFSISKPEKTNVYSIGESGKSKFLSRIYTADEFNYNNFELATLDYNSIEKQDAIILNELKIIPQALETTLKSFVQKGGNLVVIPSLETDSAQLNGFLNSFGTIQIHSFEKSDKLITKINFNHPLFNSVFEKQVQNFQYPNSKSAFQIQSAYPPVLSFQDDLPFLVSIPNPISSVYIFASPINIINSNFQHSPLIVPLFYNMGQNTQKSGINAFSIGENQPFLVDVKLGKEGLLSAKSEKETFIPMQQILNSKVKLTFKELPQRDGNYAIYNKNNFLKNISFNYNRTESNLNQANENVLGNFKVVDQVETLFTTLQRDRTDQSIWKIVVILTLLFLILEVLIQKFVK